VGKEGGCGNRVVLASRSEKGEDPQIKARIHPRVLGIKEVNASKIPI